MNQQQKAEPKKPEVAQLPSKSLVARLATKYGVDPDKFLSTLKATAFRGDGKNEVSNEQLMALLIVAEAHDLNPWLKEIYAFSDKFNGIVPIIGIDGFIKIANQNPQFNGMTFDYDDDGAWVECIIARKDRDTPTRVREYLVECQRNTPAWTQWPRRMLRHRAIAQCVRVAFGFSGVMEQDEAEAYIEGTATEVKRKPKTAAPKAIEAPKAPETVISPVITQPEPVRVSAETTSDLRVALLKRLDATGVSEREVCKKIGVELSEATAEQLVAAIDWIEGLQV